MPANTSGVVIDARITSPSCPTSHSCPEPRTRFAAPTWVVRINGSNRATDPQVGPVPADTRSDRTPTVGPKASTGPARQRRRGGRLLTNGLEADVAATAEKLARGAQRR